MNYLRSLFALLYLGYSSPLIATNDIPYFSGTLEELVTLAEQKSKAYLVFGSIPGDPRSQQLESLLKKGELSFMLDRSFLLWRTDFTQRSILDCMHMG